MIASTAELANVPHDLLVGLDLILHMLVGYVIVQYLTDLPPMWGAWGGLIPNLDLPLGLWFQPPLVHRGLIHTPLFMIVLGGVLLAIGIQWQQIAAFIIGHLAELGFDTIEGTDGIM